MTSHWTFELTVSVRHAWVRRWSWAISQRIPPFEERSEGWPLWLVDGEWSGMVKPFKRAIFLGPNMVARKKWKTSMPPAVAFPQWVIYLILKCFLCPIFSMYLPIPGNSTSTEKRTHEIAVSTIRFSIFRQDGHMPTNGILRVVLWVSLSKAPCPRLGVKLRNSPVIEILG